MTAKSRQNSPLLSIDTLQVAFQGPTEVKEVIHGINLDIAHGESLALVGESGSGKSVTAQAILQLYSPADTLVNGKIFFEGQDLLKKTPHEMANYRGHQIGIVFQDPMNALNPTMPVGKQIAEVLMRHKGMTYQTAKNESVEWLDLVRIDHPAERYDAYPFQLSGGMRQRVLIAMAIACRPSLLIADEITTALDVTIQAQILELLNQLKREIGMSLLFITHDLAVAARLCDRAAVLYQGNIVEEGPIQTLFAHPHHPYTQDLLRPL